MSETYYSGPSQNEVSQNSMQYNMSNDNQSVQQPVAQIPVTTKPRSAYIAALLHLLFGVFGFGYFYRGMNDKAKNCLIMLIVGCVGSVLFGLGAIVITACQIINIVEAVKLFKGDYPLDAYGRPLMQEF